VRRNDFCQKNGFFFPIRQKLINKKMKKKKKDLKKISLKKKPLKSISDSG
jgi:hypothetical protein